MHIIDAEVFRKLLPTYSVFFVSFHLSFVVVGFWRPKSLFLLFARFMKELTNHLILRLRARFKNEAFWLVVVRNVRVYLKLSRTVERNPELSDWDIAGGIHQLRVNFRNTRTRCEMCSKSTINTSERRQWRRSDVFIVNFEHISHLVLVFLLLTLRSICRLGCQDMSCIMGTYSKSKRLHFLAFITEKKSIWRHGTLWNFFLGCQSHWWIWISKEIIKTQNSLFCDSVISYLIYITVLTSVKVRNIWIPPHSFL